MSVAEQLKAVTNPFENNEKQVVVLNQEPVELHKILKFEGVAMSGAHAKQMIEDGEVFVNNEPEARKRRKMLAGDEVQLDGLTLVLTLAEQT